METPVYDFVQAYAAAGNVRLHMPGHKGKGSLGVEAFDITEVFGADSLYEAGGIIEKSEQNASFLFGSGNTFYSAEGSSQCVKTMLFLALMRFKELHGENFKERKVVVAARNAHKSFLAAVALLGLDVVWLWPEEQEDYHLCCCPVSEEGLFATLKKVGFPVVAVFLTSPDYLGGLLDIHVLSQVAHRFGTLLLVDNAHGAYQHFLEPAAHPLDLGADLCCDSAHKTLPVLTGGAYLHLAGSVAKTMAPYVRQALSMFGSTSPSYLILQSLDLANRYLANGYEKRLAQCVGRLDELRGELLFHGWVLYGKEPLKITVAAAKCGYDGREMASLLRAGGVECEYADPDFVVFMFTPENEEEDYRKLLACIKKLAVRKELCRRPPAFLPPRRVLSVREAVFSPYELLPVREAVGRIMGPAAVSCPPAVAVVVSGEEIGEDAAEVLFYYGMDRVAVVR
ncbi:MAG: amino acid decarboxylase [Lachnospiraceae bacterium]|nr:amino acid decarboxylase [Lachnospiraceae bacterium]